LIARISTNAICHRNIPSAAGAAAALLFETRTRAACPPTSVFATDLKLQTTTKNDIMISNYQELPMAQFIVRNLEDDVKARLKRRAAQHRRSMEEEVRHILRDAVKEQNRHIPKLGSRIAARFTKAGLSTDLPELHGQIPRSAEFGK
jgi:antitoxin FitA